MAECLMRIELGPETGREPAWPQGISTRTFEMDDAAALHALLEHGYARGGGSVSAFDSWLPYITTDQEFDPAVVFLAEADGDLAGAALCWTSAFVKDLVVHESWRRRGLGEALLRQVFATFAERGADSVVLKVHSDNDGAIRLYERVGMRLVS